MSGPNNDTATIEGYSPPLDVRSEDAVLLLEKLFETSSSVQLFVEAALVQWGKGRGLRVCECD